MSKSNQAGASKDETTETRRASQSSNVENPSTSVMSATTPKAKSPRDSQPTINLQDNTNAVRLIQALAGKLGTLVEWKKLTLGDGREVYALIFPTGNWQIDPNSKELLPSGDRNV
jgi:hypothetical protein